MSEKNKAIKKFELFPEHLRDLRKSGLSDETIRMAGLYSVPPEQNRAKLGRRLPPNTTLLAIPYPDNFERYKLFPAIFYVDGREIRYLQRAGTDVSLYVPPQMESYSLNKSKVLFVVEGEKKCLRGSQEGMCCVGISGAWCFRKKDSRDLMESITRLPLTGRDICLVPDSDFRTNPDILKSVKELAFQLTKHEANVTIVWLPGEMNKKVGLDDYFMEHSKEDFDRLERIDINHPIFEKVILEPELEGIKKAIRDAIVGYGPKFDKKRVVFKLVNDELNHVGDFYRTSEGRLYFFEKSRRQLLELEQRVFSHLVNDLTGLAPSEDFFRYVDHSLVSNISRHGALVEIHAFAAYEKDKGVVISDGASGVWFQENGGWDKANNGERDCLFLTEPEAEPWIPDFSADGSDLAWFLNCFNFAGSPEDVEAQEHILLIWLRSLFFRSSLRTQPIPAFLGDQGSGKTTCCRLVGRLFLGDKFEVTGLRDEKEDAFIASVTNKVFHAVDNVDTRIKWFPDALARYATGENFEIRRLYSNNDVVRYKPKAILMLTSRDPQFRRPDIAERLLPFELERIDKFGVEQAMYQELQKRRNRIIADLLRLVDETSVALQRIKPPMLSFRMADFASFGWQIYAHRKQERHWEDLLVWLENKQMGFASEDDAMVEVVRILLGKNLPSPITTGELFRRARVVAELHGIPIAKTANVFGRQLSQRKRMIEVALGVRMRFRGRHGASREVYFIRDSSRNASITSIRWKIKSTGGNGGANQNKNA